MLNIALSKIKEYLFEVDLKKIDFFTAFFIAIYIYLFGYVFLGFYSSGLNIPFAWGGDGVDEYVGIKNIIENGWFYTNPSLGAPFSADTFDFANKFLMQFEFLTDKVLSLFTSNYLVIFNIQFLFTLALCAFNSYIVLRVFKLNRYFSTIGSIIFSLTPYIFRRGLGHYCLAACYFIPFSILLCVWCNEIDDDYLNLKKIKSFFYNKKNLLTVLFAFLIANNGIGYYPFFTCFLLCVVFIDKFFRKVKFSEAIKPFIPVFFIVFFMMLELLPVFIHNFYEGANDIATRYVGEGEIYGLKLVQLFLPSSSKNPFLSKIINEYNSSAPLVNENCAAYLGIFGCIGLVISFSFIFITSKNENSSLIKLFSKLNLATILFFSVGGFIILFNLLTGFRSLRGFNRISIFISFMSICSLCFFLQNLSSFNFLKGKKYYKKIFYAVVSLFVICCIYELKPSRHKSIESHRLCKMLFDSDEKFVKEFEKKLKDNDAVYCLPYHKYPEAGFVNDMKDYDLFTGYLHSSKLRWSYGGMKGRKSDKWNERVSLLKMDKLIPTIIGSGFKGIYIDARAYLPDELEKLLTSIENVLDGEKPIISENKNLYFFDLSYYINGHSNLLNYAFDYEYPDLNINTNVLFCGPESNGCSYIYEGLSQQEQDFTWTNGKKFVFKAKFLDFDSSKLYKMEFNLANVFAGEQRVVVKVNDEKVFEENVTDLEFTIPLSIPDSGKTCIELYLPDAISPRSLNLSTDDRILALALKSITFSKM